jgi:hypothetical protein
MKRLLGALGFVGATLFAVSGANAAILGPINVGPGPAQTTFDGGAGYTNNGVFDGAHVWAFNVSNLFADPVAVYISYSTQSTWTSGNLFSGFGLQLCSLSDCSSGNIGSVFTGNSNPSGVLVFDLLATGLLPGNTYYLWFGGEPQSSTSWSYSFQGVVTPIPAAALLFASGLGFIGFAGRKRKGQLAVASDEVSGTRA